MNKSLIFSLYILAITQNNLFAMEKIEEEEIVERGEIEEIEYDEEVLNTKEIKNKLNRYDQKIEVLKTTIKAREEELTSLKKSETKLLNLEGSNKKKLSPQEKKKQIIKLKRIELQKNQKKLTLQITQKKLEKLEQKKEQLIKGQKQEQQNLGELRKLRTEKIKDYVQTLENLNVEESEINNEITKCYGLGQVPGQFILEKTESDSNSTDFGRFVKEGYNSIEQKICVFPLENWKKFFQIYSSRIKWRADQKNNKLSIGQNSEIITRFCERIFI